MKSHKSNVVHPKQAKERKLKYIDAIDFELLANRLCDEEIATDLDPLMDRDLCDALITNYKRFLKLNVLYNDRTLIPTFGIDVIWHYHILDTKRYIADCRYLFDGYLHHIPNYHPNLKSGRSSVDITDMDALFHEHFGASVHVHYAGQVY